MTTPTFWSTSNTPKHNKSIVSRCNHWLKRLAPAVVPALPQQRETDGGKGGQGTEGLEGGVGVEEEAEECLQLRQEGEGERLHLVEDAQHVLGEAGN